MSFRITNHGHNPGPGPNGAFWVVLMGLGGAEIRNQAGTKDRSDRAAKSLHLGDRRRQGSTEHLRRSSAEAGAQAHRP